MPTCRRDFLEAATGPLGAIGGSRLAPWSLEAEAAQAAALDASRGAGADAALATARRRGGSYADVRIIRLRSESIATREQQVQNVSRNQSIGIDVRVLVDGTWGFAASAVVSADEARRVADAAPGSRGPTRGCSAGA